MTHADFDHGAATLVRAADAEVVGSLPQMVRLLADSSAAGGRLSAQRVTLGGGADGANPPAAAAAGSGIAVRPDEGTPA